MFAEDYDVIISTNVSEALKSQALNTSASGTPTKATISSKAQTSRNHLKFSTVLNNVM